MTGVAGNVGVPRQQVAIAIDALHGVGGNNHVRDGQPVLEPLLAWRQVDDHKIPGSFLDHAKILILGQEFVGTGVVDRLIRITSYNVCYTKLLRASVAS